MVEPVLLTTLFRTIVTAGIKQTVTAATEFSGWGSSLNNSVQVENNRGCQTDNHTVFYFNFICWKTTTLILTTSPACKRWMNLLTCLLCCFEIRFFLIKAGQSERNLVRLFQIIPRARSEFNRIQSSLVLCQRRELTFYQNQIWFFFLLLCRHLS